MEEKEPKNDEKNRKKSWFYGMKARVESVEERTSWGTRLDNLVVTSCKVVKTRLEFRNIFCFVVKSGSDKTISL